MSSYLFDGPSIGFRDQFKDNFLKPNGPFSWTEVLVDNFLHFDQRSLETLTGLSEKHTFAFHCVNHSVGQEIDLDSDYYSRVKKLVGKFSPKVVSDHLCWNIGKNKKYHDLLPFAFNQKTLFHRISSNFKSSMGFLLRSKTYLIMLSFRTLP